MLPLTRQVNFGWKSQIKKIQMRHCWFFFQTMFISAISAMSTASTAGTYKHIKYNNHSNELYDENTQKH